MTLTPTDIREIAAESGMAHAEFCVEQEATQIGRAAAQPLYDELNTLEREALESAAAEALR